MYAYLTFNEPKINSIGVRAYLLKYWTRPSMQPTKHSAQHARIAATAMHNPIRHNTAVKKQHYLRDPSCSALFLIAWKSSRIISRIVTMSEPKAIDPSENVDARTKADVVG